MRARTIREGSVGLLIVAGIGLFGFLVLWLRGFRVGAQSYQVTVGFDNTLGMQVGAQVRYRGVPIGKVLAIRPQASQVEVDIEIERVDLQIPRSALIEANQSGFLGETSIDITPDFDEPIAAAVLDSGPLSPDCNSEILICAGDQVAGEIGVSFEKLIRSTADLSDRLTDDELFANIKNLTENSATAAGEAAELSQEVTELVQIFQRELGPLSASTQGVANSFARAADEFSLTAEQSRDFLAVNRATLIATLENLEATSRQVQIVAEEIAPLIQQGDFIRDINTLTENAAIASANLRDLSVELNDPATIILLQQTLESARSTFQNVQKITADLDELTGDAELREDIRRLIQGFGGLVSTTTDLNQQTQWVNSTIAPADLSLETLEWTPLNLQGMPAPRLAPEPSPPEFIAPIQIEPIWGDLDPQELAATARNTGETVAIRTANGAILELQIPQSEAIAPPRPTP